MGKGFFLFIGLVLLTIGLALFFDRVSKIKSGIVTEATVLRIEKKRDGDEVLYRPILKFINYKNEPMICKPDFDVNNHWHTGETAKILYTKDRYDNITIITYFRTFGAVLFLLSGALVSLIFAVGGYWSRHFFNSLNKPVPAG